MINESFDKWTLIPTCTAAPFMCSNSDCSAARVRDLKEEKRPRLTVRDACDQRLMLKDKRALKQ